MNVLTGVFPRDAGEIEFDGNEVGTVTIRQSEAMGIAFVHQELNLFNDLKVYENIFLGKEYCTKTGRLNKKKMIAEARGLFEELGVDIDPTELVESEHTLSAAKLPIHKKKEKEKFEKYRALLNIKAQSPESSILSLSGGNQSIN